MTTTDWITIIMTALATAASTVAGVAFYLGDFIGAIKTKIKNIEDRLGRNGVSIPSRCREHSVQIEDHDRRLTAVEE